MFNPPGAEIFLLLRRISGFNVRHANDGDASISGEGFDSTLRDWRGCQLNIDNFADVSRKLSRAGLETKPACSRGLCTHRRLVDCFDVGGMYHMLAYRDWSMAGVTMGLLACGRSALHKSGGRRYQCNRGHRPKGDCRHSDSDASPDSFIEPQVVKSEPKT